MELKSIIIVELCQAYRVINGRLRGDGLDRNLIGGISFVGRRRTGYQWCSEHVKMRQMLIHHASPADGRPNEVHDVLCAS